MSAMKDKKYVINAERDAYPHGKELIANKSLLAAGRLLLVTTLITKTKIMSNTNPEMIFLLIHLNRF